MSERETLRERVRDIMARADYDGEPDGRLVGEIMALIPEAPATACEWIVRKDGMWPSLPASGVLVLVQFRFGGQLYVEFGCRDRGLSWKGSDFCVMSDLVTAWMPLPAPPVGKEE